MEGSEGDLFQAEEVKPKSRRVCSGCMGTTARGLVAEAFEMKRGGGGDEVGENTTD